MGKLFLENITPEDFPQLCHQMNLDALAASAEICSFYHRFAPFSHRDPFDRMLVWLAKCERFTLLSKDSTLRQSTNQKVFRCFGKGLVLILQVLKLLLRWVARDFVACHFDFPVF